MSTITVFAWNSRAAEKLALWLDPERIYFSWENTIAGLKAGAPPEFMGPFDPDQFYVIARRIIQERYEVNLHPDVEAQLRIVFEAAMIEDRGYYIFDHDDYSEWLVYEMKPIHYLEALALCHLEEDGRKETVTNPTEPRMDTKVPNPGSDEAIAQGCRCPVLDNSHGRGYMGNPEVFVMTTDCPLHNPPKVDSNESL